MQYLDEFRLPGISAEEGFVLSVTEPRMNMRCYSDNVYPFKIFPARIKEDLRFEQITLFYGGNGSGKSTLLNVIAEKLELDRVAPFNKTPFYSDFLRLCGFKLTYGKRPPAGSRIITSDDVFDFMLDLRSVNEGIENRRQLLFEEFDKYKDPNMHVVMRSLDDYDELKKKNSIRRASKSEYTARRIPSEVYEKSNGESAFAYFTHEIKENALYILDEPENSLSAKLQKELCDFITDSARFYNCQFIISTHSPFLLSMKNAKIYNMDSTPVRAEKWTELENIILYHRLFEQHRNEFI